MDEQNKLKDCTICLLTPLKTFEQFPQFNDKDFLFSNVLWRLDWGNCECNCKTCIEVQDQQAMYLFRYTSKDREVIKCNLGLRIKSTEQIVANEGMM